MRLLRKGQQKNGEFEASLGYIARLCQKEGRKEKKETDETNLKGLRRVPLAKFGTI
jgi:hypothetical protein